PPGSAATLAFETRRLAYAGAGSADAPPQVCHDPTIAVRPGGCKGCEADARFEGESWRWRGPWSRKVRRRVMKWTSGSRENIEDRRGQGGFGGGMRGGPISIGVVVVLLVLTLLTGKNFLSL